jgi:hypothetical protein
MGRAEAKAGLLKGQLVFIIEYLTSFQKLPGCFLSAFPYLSRCGCQYFSYTPSLENLEHLIFVRYSLIVDPG